MSGLVSLQSQRMQPVEPTALAVTVGERVVPAVLWRGTTEVTPLVLLGHGGSGHKTAPRQMLLANRLVAAGLTVVAIDGPLHGERAGHSMSPGEYQAALVARGVESVIGDMVDDWRAAVDAARALGAVDERLGYLGLSMGTRFGLPLAAELGGHLTCAVLGKFGLQQSSALHPGLHDTTQLRRDAARVDAPTLWHVQWDDDLFPRSGQLEIFDVLGAKQKRLLAFPGDHGSTADDAVDAWVSFLVRHLSAPEPDST